MSCGAGCRCGSDISLLWLGHRSAATASVQLLAWELPYATSATLKKQKKKTKKTKDFTKKTGLLKKQTTLCTDIL